jgi:hypothetical protein
MKKFILSIFASLLTVGAAFGQKIYSTNHQYQADIKVFVVDSEYRADLVVYKTDKEYRAKASENKGIWFFTDKQYRADKKVYFVDSEPKPTLRSTSPTRNITPLALLPACLSLLTHIA